MGSISRWALATVLAAGVPGCISVPRVGSIWMDSGEPECATVRAHTHTQALVFSTLTPGAIAAWQGRIPDASEGAPVRMGLASVRGLGMEQEAFTTVLRIDRGGAGSSIARTYAYLEGATGDDGAPPADGRSAVRIEGEGLVIDGVARRGTERAILVGSQRDEGGAHGVIVFSPGSPGLLLRETHCRAMAEELPTDAEAAPAVEAPPSTSPAPVQIPAAPEEEPAPGPVQIPAPAPVQVPAPT